MGQRQGRTSTGGGQRALLGYALAALTVIFVSLAGYIGYVLYPRFDLPGVSVAGLFVLAAGAGIACFFSPCSFPLLVSLFGRSPSNADADRPSWRQTLPFAIGLSAGATVFLLLIGTIVGLAGTAVFADVVFTSTEGIILRFVIGTLLILLGLIQVGALRISLPPVQNLADPLVDAGTSTHAGKGVARTSLFGFGYLVAGFGWTGPILAGLAAHALVIGGTAAALGAFATASVVILLLMFGLAFAVTTAHEQTIRALRMSTNIVKRAGGAILLGVGIWFLALAIWADYFATVFPVWVS